MRRRIWAIAALALVTIVVTAAPAVARDKSSSGDRRISVTGDITVARGETVHGPVVAVDGNATINGTVTDYVGVGNGNLVVSGHVTRGVVVVHGDARISGRVGGDVVALSGRVIVTSGAHVGGDVVSRLTPKIASGTVAGEVKRFDLGGIFTGIIIGFLAFLWVAVTISIAVLGLLFVALFPRAADTAAAAGKRVGASIGWGALVGIIGPIVAVLVVATVIGIPLGLGMLGALNLLAPLGYVTTALVIGRIWVRGPSSGARIGAFFAGFGILRLVALVPGLGLLVWLLACIYGLGAISMAAWYGGRRRPEPEPEPEPTPVVAPPEAPEPETEPVAVTAPASTSVAAPAAAPTAAPTAVADTPDPPPVAWSHNPPSAAEPETEPPATPAPPSTPPSQPSSEPESGA